MPIEISKQRWHQIQSVLDQVLSLSKNQQIAALTEACDGDAELFQDIKNILDQEQDALTLLEQPALNLVQEFTQLSLQATPSKEHTYLDLSGSQVGAFVIREKLGVGGMGVVYRAERNASDFDQQVAIKFLSNWQKNSPRKDRFVHEQQLLARLQHPNIARLYDGGITEQGQPYLIMEYVQGLPLDQYCDDHNLSVNERLELSLQISEALSYAHTQLIVHRDIKPSNILVTESGAIKLLDFGVAKLIDQRTDLELTRTHEQILTPGFATPEQLQNQTITVGTDIYQLGLVTYSLLCGRQAYSDQASSLVEMVKVICENQVTRPSAMLKPANNNDEQLNIEQLAALRNTDGTRLYTKLRGEIDLILLKMLNADPKQRYQSMEALGSDITAYFEHRPLAAHQPSFYYLSRKVLRRHWRAALIAGAFISLLVAYALTTARQAERIQQALEASIREQEKSQSVADFMINIFKAADPNVSGLETITAKELLNQGQQRIREELSIAPAIQAHMLTSIGEIYYSQGDSAASKELLEEALQRQLRAGSGNELSKADTLTQLAIVYSTTNDYQLAEDHFQESMKLYENAQQPELLNKNADYGELINAYGFLILKKGNVEKAESYFHRAIKILRDSGASGQGELAVTLNNLGNLQAVAGRLEAAVDNMRQAIVLHERTLGERHSYFSIYLINYANYLTKLERYPEAKKILQRALSLQRQTLGEQHNYLSNTLRILGVLSHKTGSLEEAKDHLQKALDIRMANAQIDSLMVATTHLQLGDVLIDSGQYAEAENHLSHMQRLHQNLNAGDHIVGLGLCSIAKLQLKRGNADRAQATYRRAINLLNSAKIRQSIAHLGYALAQLELGNALLAKEFAQNALNTRLEFLPSNHGQIFEAQAVLGLALEKSGEKEGAMKLLQALGQAFDNMPEYQYGGATSVHMQVQAALSRLNF